MTNAGNRSNSPRPSAPAIAAAAIGGALVSAAALTAGFARPAITADTFRQLDLFGEVFEQVHANYVESPEDSLLIKGAIDGMLAELDPHSSYLPADDFERMQEQTRGSFAGLGIQIVMDTEGEDKGLVKVISPIDDTPAARAGIQTNDLIVEIDGETVQGLSIDDAIDKLKGPKGTPVSISILRDRSAQPFKLTLIRDIVKVDAVASRAEGAFGYIRVRTFSELAEDGVKKAIKSLDKEIPGGPKGYILDLRSNPGGLLDQAVSISDIFLDGGEIVSTRGRHPKDTMREMGAKGDLANGKPVVVLINGGSASASEIVAGALQDRNRALLLGTRSFGKGSVQTVIPLQNGLQGALRLTTARYYTPAGRSIQAEGIDPDIAMPVIYPGQDATGKGPSEADLPGALDANKKKKAAADAALEAAPKTPPAGSPVPKPEANKPGNEKTTGEKAISGGTDAPEVEPFLCAFEKDGKTPVDCQLKRAVEILSDPTRYRSLLADAGAEPKPQKVSGVPTKAPGK